VILAFDYDGTWSADAGLFDDFVTAAISRGHTCIVVTNRSPGEGAGLADLLRPVRVIFASGGPKRAAALAAGFAVDVWIDDNPILVDKGAAGIVEIGHQHA